MNREGQREEEPWNLGAGVSGSTGASQFNDPIMMSQWPNVSLWEHLYSFFFNVLKSVKFRKIKIHSISVLYKTYVTKFERSFYVKRFELN